MGWRLASILLFGLVFMFFACMIKINYQFPATQNEYQYYAGSILFFVSSMVAAAGAGEILYSTIPPYLALGYWNAGMIAGTAELLGKTIGNIAFFFYAYVNREHKNRAEPLYAYIVNAAVVFILIVLTSVWFWRLRRHNVINLVDN